MTVGGVVDRIVDGETAVVLVESEGLEFNLSVEELPSDVEEGSWLVLEIEDGEVVSMELDEEEAQERRERIEEKMEGLRERGRKGSEKVE